LRERSATNSSQAQTQDVAGEIALVTDTNPVGDLTISDFKLAAKVTHHAVLVHAVDLQERTNNTCTITLQWYTDSGRDPPPPPKQQITYYGCKLSTNTTIFMCHVMIFFGQDERHDGRLFAPMGTI
jgi:hypothetical protein